MEFISSHGTLVINKKGLVNKKESDLSDWLETIKKVDVEELTNYYKLNGIDSLEDGDVLDFGYWDKENNYHAPEREWRIETFHNQDLTEKEVKLIVEKSFKWIEKNRK